MTELPSEKKRTEPAAVAPVELAGVRYEAPPLGAPFGIGQDGGFIVARDAAGGDVLWTAIIYPPASDEAMEDDKRDVFIVSLAPAEGGGALVIGDERGRRYRFDLAARTATPYA